ncbi:peptidase M20 [Calothrix sp. NIES-4071]|nr:peptidase M20 [Calothrix sp. NIES-4071]BAZ60500.1 peptidase M20 [Calothrix sp. NIES-4105]
MKSHANAKINLIIILTIAIIIISIILSPFNSVTAARNVNLYQKAQQAQSEFLKKLEPLVNIDSGTGYAEGITKVEDIVIEHLKLIGAQIETTKATTGVGRNIIATIQGTGKSKKNILLLAHSDTVFKEKTAAERPFKIVDGKAKGPGVMDDKGGIILGIEALKILKEINFNNFGKISFLINPDEEKGSRGSRELIKQIAKQHDYALVLEFGSPQDKVTSWRKGIGNYGFEVKGKAAHAGAEPEKGCNALLEAAHQTLQMKNLANPSKQTTVNFTLFQAGERANIIPDTAKVQADVRVLEAVEFDRLERDFTKISQNKLLPCTQIKVVAERGRPPFAPNSKTDALVKKAQAIYKEIQLNLGVEGSGGGTDGNYAAAVGTATLDALGPVGGGAHSSSEYIDLERIAPRIYLLTKLIMDLGA